MTDSDDDESVSRAFSSSSSFIEVCNANANDNENNIIKPNMGRLGNFENYIWKKETFTFSHFVLWIMLNLPIILMSIMTVYSIKLEWSILIMIVVYTEKILSILYVVIYSCVRCSLLIQFQSTCCINMILSLIVSINLLYIGYRFFLFLYYSIFTEFVTFWMVLQAVNYVSLRGINFQFSQDWHNNINDNKIIVDQTQNGCNEIRQNISMIHLYLDNISSSYIPTNTTISDKTKRLIKYIIFHLGLILLLLQINAFIRKYNQYYTEQRNTAYLNKVDTAINDLMECINSQLVDYHNKHHIDCPHFIDYKHKIKHTKNEPHNDVKSERKEVEEENEIDFDLKKLLISSDKVSQSANFILTIFYAIIHYICWYSIDVGYRILSVIIAIIGVSCFIYYVEWMLDSAEWKPENWRLHFFGSHANRHCIINYNINTMKIRYNSFCRIYGCIKCLDEEGYKQLLILFMRPNSMTHLSPYQRTILLNFELFLPIYFSWHIISTAFNDNFSISKIIINYLYGATQFILNDSDLLRSINDTTKFENKLHKLYDDQIISFSKVYDEICNEYEVV